MPAFLETEPVSVAADYSDAVIKTNMRFPNLPVDLMESARVTHKHEFDPARHLAFQRPQKNYSFNDLGLPDSGISSHAVSEPFSLFTTEAIQQMRAELLSPEVIDKHHCQTSHTGGIIRGHCPRSAPFIYRAWTSPEVTAIVSAIAGVDLVPAIDYDIGHTNISINSAGEEQVASAPGEQTAPSTEKFCESAFGWHTDSYPFVVVLMLSDCTGMVGGETAIRLGNGEIMKARGPSLGSAVVMQGQHVPHQATTATGGRERISMVTSFRPRDCQVQDGTILRGVRNISHLPTLYYQYSLYRLENLEQRLHNEVHSLYRRRNAGLDYDTQGMRQFLLRQQEFIDQMLQDIQ